MIIKTDKRKLNPVLKEAVRSYNSAHRQYHTASVAFEKATWAEKQRHGLKEFVDAKHEVLTVARSVMLVLEDLGLVTIEKEGYGRASMT